jgi:hypothetical protein
MEPINGNDPIIFAHHNHYIASQRHEVRMWQRNSTTIRKPERERFETVFRPLPELL